MFRIAVRNRQRVFRAPFHPRQQHAPSAVASEQAEQTQRHQLVSLVMTLEGAPPPIHRPVLKSRRYISSGNPGAGRDKSCFAMVKRVLRALHGRSQ